MDSQSDQFVEKRSRGIVFALACLFFLSFMPIISQSRPGRLSALDFALYLSVWELIFSLPLVVKETSAEVGVFARKLTPSSRRRIIATIVGTGIIFTLTTFLYVLSFETAGTVSASIALQAYPLFSLLLEAMLLRKFKTRSELGFTLMLVLAIYFLGTGGTWVITDFSGWFALALVVPFLWSVAHIIVKEVLGSSSITPGQVTFIRVLTSSVILVVTVAATSGPTHILQGLTPTVQFFSFVMGLFYYLELIFWFYALKHIDVSLASAVTTPSPVITAILAVFILQESLAGYQVIAMIATLLSLYSLLYVGKGENGKSTTIAMVETAMPSSESAI